MRRRSTTLQTTTLPLAKRSTTPPLHTTTTMRPQTSPHRCPPSRQATRLHPPKPRAQTEQVSSLRRCLPRYLLRRRRQSSRARGVDSSTIATTRKRSLSSSPRSLRLRCSGLQSRQSVHLQTHQAIQFPNQMYSYIVHKIRVHPFSLLLSLSMSLLLLLLLLFPTAIRLLQTLLSQVLQLS
jgi:hypothetical protein